MKVATPVNTTPPDLSQGIPSVFQNYIDALTEMDDLSTAMVTAFNRAEGAWFSDKPAFVVLQMDAFEDYEQQFADVFRDIGADVNEFTAKAQMAYPDIFDHYGDQFITDANELKGVMPVSEPSTALLGGIGMFMMLAFLRLKKQSSRSGSMMSVTQ
jgi:hypothetical protein